MEFTFGSDPEFMLKSGSKFVSAIKILGHGKDDPIDLGEGQSVFYDNVLVELNIKPSTSAEEFTKNFYGALGDLKEIVGPNIDIVAQASAIYPEEELADPVAHQAGCDPEYSTWNRDEDGNIERSKAIVFSGGRRTAGGHIHIGSPLANLYITPAGSPERVINMMDLFVGNTSVLIDHDSLSVTRKKLYGAAGSHRPAKYGVEYRTLSNFWLTSPRLIKLTYDLTETALEVVASGDDIKLWEALKDFPRHLLRDAINNDSKREAEKFYRIATSFIHPFVQAEVEYAMNPDHYPKGKFDEFAEQLEVMVA